MAIIVSYLEEKAFRPRHKKEPRYKTEHGDSSREADSFMG